MDTEDKKKPTSTGDEKASGRRKLLKSVVAGGGAVTVAKVLPDQWARPVVDSVMLPAHAETSDSSLGPFVSSGPITGGLTNPNVQMAEQGFSEELLEFFAPAANAGGVFAFADGMALTANDSGDSFLCAMGTNVTTETIAVQISGDPPSFTSSKCLLGFPVTSGNYVENAGWDISWEHPNVSSDVRLIRGGSGCSESEKYHCYD